ncbi:hypothetical protein Droror1_Dr00004204 [Drosera rotundifolia]
MDCFVINAEQEGMGCGVIHRPGEYGELNASAIKHDIGILEPKLGMEFDSEDAAKSFYDEYARRVGFRTKVFPLGHLKPDGVITSCVLVCARDVSKRKTSNSCEAMFEVELKGDTWVVTRFVKEHSHTDVSSSKVRYLRPHRHSAHAAKKDGGNHQLMDAVPSGYMNASIEGALTSPEANCLVGSISPVKSNPLAKGSSSMNHRHAIPRGTLGKETQNMLDYFKKMQAENPGFFYAIQLDEQGQMANAFWSDVRVPMEESSPDDGLGIGSTASRYNSLCQEVFRYAEDGACTPETYRAALSALREGAKTVHMLKKNVVRLLPDISQASAVGYDDKRTSPQGGDMNPQFWPRQDESTRQFSLNDNNLHSQLGANSKLPRLVLVSLQRDDGVSDSTVKIPCLKSLTWEMENKKSPPVNRVAVINLKLQDNSKNPPGESDVKFQLSLVVLEPMLRSMADINKQLLTAANRVSVIKLKLHDIEMTSGESEVKFQVSRDTLGAMMRSMAYIKEQLSNPVEIKTERPSKRSRK